jgi:TonB family protein
MRMLIFILFFFPVFSLVAQDTVYFNNDGDTVYTKTGYDYYKVVKMMPDGSALEQEYNYGDTLVSETNYSVFSKKEIIKQGYYTKWYTNGQIYIRHLNDNNRIQGYYRVYWKNGIVKREEFYKKGVFQNGKCYDSTGKEVDFYEFSIQPAYTGGDAEMIKYLVNHVKYPDLARENGISGTVFIQFIVRKDGRIDNVKIKISAHPSLDEESLRVIRNMPPWQPGYYDGKASDVKMVLPLKYILDDGGYTKKKKKKRSGKTD